MAGFKLPPTIVPKLTGGMMKPPKTVTPGALSTRMPGVRRPRLIGVGRKTMGLGAFYTGGSGMSPRRAQPWRRQE